MSFIETNSLKNSGIGIMNNIPSEVLNKLNLSNYYFETSEDKIEVIIISGDSVDNLIKFVDNLGGKYEDLGYDFGLVTIPVNKIIDLSLNSKIQYIELPKSLYLTDIESNIASCIPSVQNEYGIFGEGILVGFIDTGIDYTNNAFKNEDGTSRIEYIYDLSNEGTIYNKNQINEAIKASNPLDIVNSTDIVGHGTHVAGIACAGGKINKKYYGVAPKSSIAVVKVTRTQYALSTLIMRGLRFLVDKSKELEMPLVVNMSLSTNDGAHNGSSLLEKYIETVSTIERASIVIAAGNEGEAAHHIGGVIEDIKEAIFNVADDERIVVINLYKSILPQISIELKSPSGFTTGEIHLSEGIDKGAIGNTRYQIFTTGPKPFDISGEITISLTGLRNYVTGGQWKLILRRTNKHEGYFDMWLPISEGLNIKTKFLQPTIDNTLGIPATVRNVISVGSYNYLTNNISPFSGRGRSIYPGEVVKPDLVAPGEGIYSTVPNNSFERKTGTSMATPHITGICALLMEWGLVKKNDPYLYGERLRYYLIIGAKRDRKDMSYPDESWGYGKVCMQTSLDIVSQTINSLLRKKNNNREDEVKNSVIQAEGSNNTKEILSVNKNKDDSIFVLAEVPDIDEFDKILNVQGVRGVRLSEQFVILIIPVSKYKQVISMTDKIIDTEQPTILTLSAITPLEASGTNVIANNPYLRLNGNGVVVAIIDTGIDYLNKEFQREDGTTRIFRIWDQTIEGDKEILGLEYGSEYTEEQINEALKLQREGGDPYTIVPSKDEIGHGTMMAGIIGGRGIDSQLKGAAPDCQFIIVKLAQASKAEKDIAYVETNIPAYTPWTVLLATRYINITAKKYHKPVVMYMPLGSNMGAHNGTGIIETNINTYSRQIGTVVITSSGNQGESETHTEGRITNDSSYRDIEIRVGKMQKVLPIQIWIKKPNRFVLSIVSPSGEVIENMTSKNTNKREINFLYEKTEMLVDFRNPEPITGDGLIFIGARNLKEGIWKLRLTPQYIVDGQYYAWIPQRELLDNDTKFLSPSENTTITLPGTSDSIITVGYYNQDNNAVVGASGRGFTTNGMVRPDIVAGGVNALVPKVGGGTIVISGSSVAAAIVSGCCALILQWAIIEKNDPELYSSELKTYIISGANGRTGDLYPNREWGYGRFDLVKIFELIRNVYAPKSRVESNYDEYTIRNLFIRKPSDC